MYPTEFLILHVLFLCHDIFPSIGVTGIVTTLPIPLSHNRLPHLHIETIYETSCQNEDMGKEELVAVMFVPKVL